MNLKCNCCDGIYNSLDIHFTSACDNNYDKWCDYHSWELYRYYYDLRDELMKCSDYKENINV